MADHILSSEPTMEGLLSGLAIPAPDRRPLSRIHGSIVQVQDVEPDPTDPELVRAVVSIVCPDVPGMLASVTGALWHDGDANIVAAFGGRMLGDVHGSFLAIRTTRKQLGMLIHEVNMLRCDEIRPDDSGDRGELKPYELGITAPDRAGIFYEVATTLTKDGRNINIVSQRIVTKAYREAPDFPYTHIHLRLEVPSDTIPLLPLIIDEIRQLSRGEQWLVTPREPDSLDGSDPLSLLGAHRN